MPFLEETYKWIPELAKEKQSYLDICEQTSQFLTPANENGECFQSIGYLDSEVRNMIHEQFLAWQQNHPADTEPNDQEIIAAFENPESRNEKMKVLTYHVLSNCLSRSEFKQGFTCFTEESEERTITFLGFIAPDQFREQIAQGQPFKDTLVAVSHGEYTHRIQWYMIMQGLNQKKPESDTRWAEFYKWIGITKHRALLYKPDRDRLKNILEEMLKDEGYDTNIITPLIGKFEDFLTRQADKLEHQDLLNALEELKPDVSSDNGWLDFCKKVMTETRQTLDMHPDSFESLREFQQFKQSDDFKRLDQDQENQVNNWWKLGLWDALVDRNPFEKAFLVGPYNTLNSLDFRSPENLNQYLVKSTNPSWKFLTAFLKGRANKRNQMDPTRVVTSETRARRGNFLARKLYDRPLEKLSPRQQEIIALYALDVWTPTRPPILLPSNKPAAADKRKDVSSTQAVAVFLDHYAGYQEFISKQGGPDEWTSKKLRKILKAWSWKNQKGLAPQLNGSYLSFPPGKDRR